MTMRYTRTGKTFQKSHPMIRRHHCNLYTKDASWYWLSELSPDLSWVRRPFGYQARLFFYSVFKCDDLLYMPREDRHSTGRIGSNLMTRDLWLSSFAEQLPFGDSIVPNPFTGQTGRTKAGYESLIANECFSAFPYMVLKFNFKPFAYQVAFWRNVLLTSPIADRIVSLTSGESGIINGLLNVGCNTQEEFRRVGERIMAIYGADAENEFNMDKCAISPRAAVSIPGLCNIKTGVCQALLYLNPSAATRVISS